MDESERLERLRQNHYDEDRDIIDEKLAQRILLLLNDSKINKFCMVDAYYYDFSVIPKGVQERLQLWRDAYLIYGITIDGEIISKWIDRWDLDSDDPIVNGEVMHNENPKRDFIVPEISQMFDSKLLQTPAPDFMKMFGKNG
jgi:hypothetical protein